MLNRDEIRDRVRARIEPRLGGRTLADSDDMFALGYVNSLFALQLVRMIEKEFGLRLGSEDMDFDNFRTVNGIITMVSSKVPTEQP
jgi:methoxymalonate biosynthesis acyl carrier protein